MDPSRLERAVRWQEEEGTRLGAVLLRLNYIEERVLLAFLARRLGVEPVMLRDQWVDPAATSLISAETARQTNAIPYELGEDRSVVVAMTDPDNLYALDDLRAATGLKVVPRLASDPAVAEALERHYPELIADPEQVEDKAPTQPRFEEPMGTGEVTDLASRLVDQVLPWLPQILGNSIDRLTTVLPADLLRIAVALKHRLDAAPRAREAARDLVKRPADVDLQAQLRVQIRQLLRVNPPFASEVRTSLAREPSGPRLNG